VFFVKAVLKGRLLGYRSLDIEFYTLPGYRLYFFKRGAGVEPLAGGNAPTSPLTKIYGLAQYIYPGSLVVCQSAVPDRVILHSKEKNNEIETVCLSDWSNFNNDVADQWYGTSCQCPEPE
jgi:hypothetical protein